ncbi:MAG: hypothetical protein AABY84_06520 [Candidatus Firestonebacteria bacterium]
MEIEISDNFGVNGGLHYGTPVNVVRELKAIWNITARVSEEIRNKSVDDWAKDIREHMPFLNCWYEKLLKEKNILFQMN